MIYKQKPSYMLHITDHILRILQSPPFLMKKEDEIETNGRPLHGNDRYEGQTSNVIQRIYHYNIRSDRFET